MGQEQELCLLFARLSFQVYNRLNHIIRPVGQYNNLNVLKLTKTSTVYALAIWSGKIILSSQLWTANQCCTNVEDVGPSLYKCFVFAGTQT